MPDLAERDLGLQRRIDRAAAGRAPAAAGGAAPGRARVARLQPPLSRDGAARIRRDRAARAVQPRLSSTGSHSIDAELDFGISDRQLWFTQRLRSARPSLRSRRRSTAPASCFGDSGRRWPSLGSRPTRPGPGTPAWNISPRRPRRRPHSRARPAAAPRSRPRCRRPGAESAPASMSPHARRARRRSRTRSTLPGA